jgi:hypothetical protein
MMGPHVTAPAVNWPRPGDRQARHRRPACADWRRRTSCPVVVWHAPRRRYPPPGSRPPVPDRTCNATSSEPSCSAESQCSRRPVASRPTTNWARARRRARLPCIRADGSHLVAATVRTGLWVGVASLCHRRAARLNAMLARPCARRRRARERRCGQLLSYPVAAFGAVGVLRFAAPGQARLGAVAGTSLQLVVATGVRRDQ